MPDLRLHCCCLPPQLLAWVICPTAPHLAVIHGEPGQDQGTQLDRVQRPQNVAALPRQAQHGALHHACRQPRGAAPPQVSATGCSSNRGRWWPQQQPAPEAPGQVRTWVAVERRLRDLGVSRIVAQLVCLAQEGCPQLAPFLV